MLTVDCRCMCGRCEARTTNIYRMIGSCSNCGTKDILMLIRAGDKAGDATCPVCEVWHAVKPLRLATPDEIPASVPEGDTP